VDVVIQVRHRQIHPDVLDGIAVNNRRLVNLQNVSAGAVAERYLNPADAGVRERIAGSGITATVSLPDTAGIDGDVLEKSVVIAALENLPGIIAIINIDRQAALEISVVRGHQCCSVKRQPGIPDTALETMVAQ